MLNANIINDLKTFLKICKEERLFTINEKAFTKERKLTYDRTVALIMNMLKRSLSIEIDELLYFKSMVESNEEIICNYFINGETNAKAEAINSKIQKFISSNQGTRDRNFFFFRLSIYYT